MAIKLSEKTNVEAPSGDYEYGSIKDAGGTAGTPVNRETYSDLHQFFERLMAQAGVTHNDLPDNTTNGYQLFEALQKLFVRNSTTTSQLITKVIEIGDWNMYADVSGVTSKQVAHGLGSPGFKKIRAALAVIRPDTDNNYQHWPQTSASITVTDATNITLFYDVSLHPAGTGYNSNFYDSTGFNRGWVTIMYEA